MKKRSMRLLAAALTAVMSCSVITGWANTAEIVSITVTPDGGTAVTYTANDTFSVSSSDLVSVKVKIKDTSAVAIDGAEATFLSYVNTAIGDVEGVETVTLDDTTIQYVDQQTTAAPVVETPEEGEGEGEAEPASEDDTDAYAVFTFRPRMSNDQLKLTGAHTAKVGGTDVDAPAEFAYSVAEAAKDLNLSVDKASVTAGETVTFTVTSADGLPSAVTVTGLPDYTSDYDSTTGKFTWTAVQGTYNVTVSADGYEAVTAVTITVASADEEDLAPEDAEAVKEQLDSIVIEANPTSNTVELTTTVTGADGETEYNINYDVKSTSNDVTYSNGVITYSDNPVADVTRVAVTASVGTTDNGAEGKTSYIFFVKDGVTLGFGNVFGIINDAGKDVFADDGTFEAALTNSTLSAEFETARAKALSIVLGKADKNSIAKSDETLNWNYDEEIALSEYNIMRHMLKGSEGYSPDELPSKRPSKTN